MFEKTRDYPRAMTSPDAPADDAMSDAIRWFVEQAQALGGQPLLYVPQRSTPENDPQLERLSRAVKTETWQTLRRGLWTGGPVFAAWPSAEKLAEIADDYRTTALVVLSWNKRDVRAWAAASQPAMLSAGAATPAVPGPDPVVVEALKTLTVLVNHANNLAGSMDKRDAIAVMLTLHDAGYRLQAEPIYAWALGNGWPARGAERLKQLVEKINSGTRPRLQGAYPLRDDILTQWRAGAEGDQS